MLKERLEIVKLNEQVKRKLQNTQYLIERGGSQNSFSVQNVRLMPREKISLRAAASQKDVLTEMVQKEAASGVGAVMKSRPTTVDRKGRRKTNSMSYLKRYKKRDQKCQEAVEKFNEDFNEAISIR